MEICLQDRFVQKIFENTTMSMTSRLFCPGQVVAELVEANKQPSPFLSLVNSCSTIQTEKWKYKNCRQWLDEHKDAIGCAVHFRTGSQYRRVFTEHYSNILARVTEEYYRYVTEELYALFGKCKTPIDLREYIETHTASVAEIEKRCKEYDSIVLHVMKEADNTWLGGHHLNLDNDPRELNASCGCLIPIVIGLVFLASIIH